MLLLFILRVGETSTVFCTFVHHLAEMPSETQKPLSPQGKGNKNVAGTLRSHHAQLLKQALLYCALQLDQLQKCCLSPGLPLQPQDPKTSLLGLFGAPQWCCLTLGVCCLLSDEFLLQFVLLYGKGTETSD